jgi:transcriptional regulator with XRE-family HTH domain
MKERLKVLRKSLGLTQEEFGEKIGMTDASISHMESGRTALSEQNIRLICLTFDVCDKWFRTGEGEMLDEEVQLSDENRELLEYFHALTPRAQQFLIEYAKKLVSDEQALLHRKAPEKDSPFNDGAVEKWVNPIHDKRRA